MNTYGKLSLTDGKRQWLLEGLAPHVAIRLKQIFPRVSKTQVDRFTFPNDLEHCSDLEWFASRYPLDISDAAARVLKKGRKGFQARKAQLEQILLPSFVPSPAAGLKAACQPRLYQMQAAALAHATGTLLLGDDIGLGKTAATVMWLLNPACRPGLVVVDTHLQKQWLNKVEEFSDLSAHIIRTGTPYDLPPSDVYIITYGKLAGWVDMFRSRFFKSACWDEIGGLRKGMESVKGEASNVLAQNVDFRLGLSATPVYNFGIEIFNIFEILQTDVLGSRGEFIREWCSDGQHVSDPEALGSYLREQKVFLRRTREDVGRQLPQVSTMVEDIAHDQKALKSIEEIARKLALRYQTGTFEERGQAGRELDMLVRQATGISKARFIAQYARMFLEDNVPIVLAGWHRAVYDIWNEELAQWNPVMYTGSESPKQKDESKRRFLAGESNVLILSLRSGAGLDGLQARCSVVLHGELDWSPKVHEQVTGRLDREGQPNPVLSIFLVSEDGSDPPIIELLGVKAAQGTGITDPGRVFEANVPDTGRMRLLVERYLPKNALQAA
ncbi:MAG: SNF2-related protein (plasmid) [Pseudomonas rhizophila]|uniref:SNF2-related protein n=1 Tax=Pseudomonas rhizophila TaxID=2045200 RepID=UPI003F6BD485